MLVLSKKSDSRIILDSHALHRRVQVSGTYAVITQSSNCCFSKHPARRGILASFALFGFKTTDALWNIQENDGTECSVHPPALLLRHSLLECTAAPAPTITTPILTSELLQFGRSGGTDLMSWKRNEIDMSPPATISDEARPEPVPNVGIFNDVVMFFLKYLRTIEIVINAALERYEILQRLRLRKTPKPSLRSKLVSPRGFLRHVVVCDFHRKFGDCCNSRVLSLLCLSRHP